MGTAGDYYFLGKILRTHGNKGELIVQLDVDEPSDYQNLESVYLDIYGERIPFFLSSVDILERGTARLVFSDFTDSEIARELIGKEMYLPLANLPKLSGNKFYFHEVEGFEVVDSKKGVIGKLDCVLDLPRQALFRILRNDAEILIPVADEIILNVDRVQKILYIEAPEGLIDIYL